MHCTDKLELSKVFADKLFHPNHVVPSTKLAGALMEFSDNAEPKMAVELFTVS